MATGESNDDIAAHLVLNLVTVKTHSNRVMAKADARDRAQLVIAIHHSGLIYWSVHCVPLWAASERARATPAVGGLG